MLRVNPEPFKLSEYTNQDSDGNVMLKDHAYQAVSAGFVKVLGVCNATNQIIQGFVGLLVNPVATGIRIDSQDSSINQVDVGIGFPVAKDEYFEITSNMAIATNIYWKSCGELRKPIDFN